TCDSEHGAVPTTRTAILNRLISHPYRKWPSFKGRWHPLSGKSTRHHPLIQRRDFEGAARTNLLVAATRCSCSHVACESITSDCFNTLSRWLASRLLAAKGRTFVPWLGIWENGWVAERS